MGKLTVEAAVELLGKWTILNPKRLIAYATARLEGRDRFEALCEGTYGKNWRELGGWNVPVAERYARGHLAELDELWSRVVTPAGRAALSQREGE